jgi:hypothetical protein
MLKERIVQTWAGRGVMDFYISFEFECEGKYHEYGTFFCHQGLEKICKAYIIAEKAAQWENLQEQQAFQEVNKIAKELSHNLERLITDCIHGTIHKHDEEMVKVLEAAYIEARYPTPQPIHRNYPIAGFPRAYSYPLAESEPKEYASKTALRVLNKIESDFSVTIPTNKTSSRIIDEDWKRFQRVFFKLDP